MSATICRVLAWAFAGLAGSYTVNYVLTPILFGEVQVEVALRPRLYVPFDPVGWRHEDSYGAERYGMASFILRHQLLTGATRDFATQELGQASFSATESGNDVIYYALADQRDMPAGKWLFPGARLLNSDQWVLRVESDSKGNIVRYGIGVQ